MEQQIKNISYRSYLVAFFMLLFAGFVVFKLFHIQIVDGDKYRNLAQRRTLKKFVIPANRGNLYDANYNLLATSISKYDIRFDAVTPKDNLFNQEIQALAKALHSEFGKSTSYYSKLLRKARKNNNRYLLLCHSIGYSQYNKIKEFPLLKLGSNKGGLIVEQRTIREHPLGKIAQRTVGYERKDADGYYTRVGLEGAYGEYLRGTDGKRLKQKIAHGQWKPLRDNNEIEPKDGFDIVSTIDVNIQDITHHELLAQLEKFKGQHGCAVVMEVETGNIKAIANLTRKRNGKYAESFNYALGESHEPGSTFKLMSMVALLEDKAIDSSTVIDTKKGKAKFYNRTVYDSHRGGYGKISAAKAFEVSSNTAFAKMINNAYKKDPKKLLNRFYNMGLNKPLGLAIKGEGLPKFPYPGDKNWYGTTLPWMSFGYGVKLTPLQTLAFYNAVANNGVMVKPKFIKEIRSWDNVSKKIETQITNPSICSKNTAQIMQRIMKNTVERGTAKTIKTNYVSMAGKTGTCQKYYGNKNREIEYVASFAGYFPAENPKYSCIIIIHEPNKKEGYYGSTVAAPVFQRIAMKMHSGTPINQNITPINIAANTLIEFNAYSKKIDKYKTIMPNVKGMELMDALPLLENLGLNVKISGEGKINEQSINSGEKIGNRKQIKIVLS